MSGIDGLADVIRYHESIGAPISIVVFLQAMLLSGITVEKANFSTNC